MKKHRLKNFQDFKNINQINEEIENTFGKEEVILNSLQNLKGCPSCIKSNVVNIKNHLATIKDYGLGPEDPRQPNEDFWNDKAEKWGITNGDARGRLCMNCEHFLSNSAIKKCIDENEAKDFKTSMVDPKIVDIESKPVAWCMLYDITCSPTRVCDSQEMGGPIDDAKSKLLDLVKIVMKFFDIREYINPFEK